MVESRQFHLRPTTKGRQRWYYVGDRKAPPIIGPKSMNEMYKTFRNQEGVFVGDRLYEVYPVPRFVDELHALMQSTYFSFMLELGARTGLGQGLLDLMAYELQRIKIPELEILSGIKPLNRDYKPILEELSSSDRRDLDKKILNAVGLSSGRIEEFYEAYATLVSNRLGRAVSVSSS